jgi:hypothetical protein
MPAPTMTIFILTLLLCDYRTELLGSKPCFQTRYITFPWVRVRTAYWIWWSKMQSCMRSLNSRVQTTLYGDIIRSEGTRQHPEENQLESACKCLENLSQSVVG